MAIKIIVTIDVGRKSQGCTRFGVCSITVGAELSLKPHQDLGFLEWEEGSSTAKLHLRGLESMAELGISKVPIDEAIKLPFPCSDGADWFARKGKYPVKRDNSGEYLELKLSAVQEAQ